MVRLLTCKDVYTEVSTNTIFQFTCTCWLWKKRIQVFETKCWRKLLRISYWEHKINDWMRSKINFFAGPQEPLLSAAKRHKHAWYGHVTCRDSLSRTILQGNLEDGWHQGQQRECWMDNIKELTWLPVPELLTRASCRKDWKRISAELSLLPSRWPNQSRDWTVLEIHCVGSIQLYYCFNTDKINWCAENKIWLEYFFCRRWNSLWKFVAADKNERSSLLSCAVRIFIQSIELLDRALWLVDHFTSDQSWLSVLSIFCSETKQS